MKRWLQRLLGKAEDLERREDAEQPAEPPTPSGPDTEPMLAAPSVAPEDSDEYVRGDFRVKGRRRVKQLRENDEEAKTIYDGIDIQINRLKDLTSRIKAKRVRRRKMEPTS